jgi:hypothetical protein
VIGSLFGTFLSDFPDRINSHSISIVLILSIIEVINCLVYSSEQRNVILGLGLEAFSQFLLLIKTIFFSLSRYLVGNDKGHSGKQKQQITNNLELKTKLLTDKKKKYFYRNVNSFKLGIMLGFFIDAFKVGS